MMTLEEALQSAARHLHVSAETIAVERLPGGSTEAINAKISTNDGRTFVLRVLEENVPHEVTAHLAAESLGIAPKIHEHTSSHLLMEYLPGGVLQPTILRRGEVLRSLADALRKLHDHPAPPLPRQNIVETTQKKYQRVHQAIGPWPRLDQAMERFLSCAEQIGYEPRFLFCHGDVHPGNLFLHDGQVMLIDWTDSTLSDPIFDVAIASVLNGLSMEEERLFLELYLKRHPHALDWERYYFLCHGVRLGFALNLLGYLADSAPELLGPKLPEATSLQEMLGGDSPLAKGLSLAKEECYDLAQAALKEVAMMVIPSPVALPPQEQVSFRALSAQDPEVLERSFQEQGWHKPASQYREYLQQQRHGERDVLVACVDGEIVGYVTILHASQHAPFRARQIPEICDLNVLKRCQKRGVGTALIRECERRVRLNHTRVGIGVGLTQDYGPAQRLYVQLGYTPDGTGITSSGRPAPYGSQVTVDDHLVLWMTKRLV